MSSSSRSPLAFVEWFRPGDRTHAEDALAGMLAAGVTHLRTHLSWAEYHRPGGREWYDWLLPRLGREIALLPCIHYTPPSLSRTGRSSGAPTVLKDYADFVDEMLTRHGEHFEAVELWNEPNNLLDWDWRADPDYLLFCEMIGNAAHWVEHRGWRAVLGGPCPYDPQWLELMGERGVLQTVSAVGFHGFPGTWDSEEGGWSSWDQQLDGMRTLIDRFNPDAQIWITEAGYSTWRHDEIEQIRRFLEARRAPADRLYWYGWRDIPEDIAVQEGPRFDQRHYHLGAVEASGRPKLLARLLGTGGFAALEEIAALASPAVRPKPARLVAIVGGSGFIGCNLAASLLEDGDEVLLVDNLSRPGVEENLAWLVETYGERVHRAILDVRDAGAIGEALTDADAIYHLAAQTAVTTSMTDPRGDFEANALGTLNVLEAARKTGRKVPVIFASTNKVYGGLEDVALAEFGDRYLPAAAAACTRGVNEARPLDFCTPYGCSKGVADQYVLDYWKSYGLPTAVLRMSCIYGPHQFGTEDQGWVAHFLLRALAGEPISIYGDGKQVRDVLHVDDAVSAYRAARASIDKVAGRAFNLGGGPRNAISLNMLLHEIAQVTGRKPAVNYGPWRPGDQLWFVADTAKIEDVLGWRARIGWREGVSELAGWLARHRMSATQNSDKQRITA